MKDELISFAESMDENKKEYWAKYSNSGKKSIDSTELNNLWMCWVDSDKANRYFEDGFIIYDFRFHEINK